MKKPYLFKLLFFLFFASMPFLGYSQSRTIQGVVKDATDGRTLEGVSVIRNKVPVGVTDKNGEFSIAASVGDSLLFTYVGKLQYSYKVDERSVLEILLLDDDSSLDEVTVVAFGTQKKTSLVGSITTVDAKDLQIPSSNLTSAFAGRIPGLISFSPSGEPGADNAQFFIRGVTTFGYQTSPLILIDGFEASTDNLARMQPDDIESFSILKDEIGRAHV